MHRPAPAPGTAPGVIPAQSGSSAARARESLDAVTASGAPLRIFHTLDKVNFHPYSVKEYARRFLWDLVRATLIRFSFKRAERWRRFWINRFGGRVPSSSFVRRPARIVHPWLFTMGEHSCIAEDADIYNLGPITIGDHTVISQKAYLCAGTHDYMDPTLPLVRPSITIGSGVWVCAGAFIGPGVTVGDNSIVGACAVVTRDVPPGVIVAGNPARVVRPRTMPGVDSEAGA